MKLETLLYIIAGIIFIIYRHYKQSQKAKQSGPVKKDTYKAEEQSYEEEQPESNILSLGNIFEELNFEGKKAKSKIPKAEPVLYTAPVVTEQKAPFEEGRRTTETVTEKRYVAEEPVTAKAELPTEKVSDVLRKYKESISKKEKPHSATVNYAESEIQEKDFQFDARQAFIYSEIFRRKYDY